MPHLHILTRTSKPQFPNQFLLHVIQQLLGKVFLYQSQICPIQGFLLEARELKNRKENYFKGRTHHQRWVGTVRGDGNRNWLKSRNSEIKIFFGNRKEKNAGNRKAEI